MLLKSVGMGASVFKSTVTFAYIYIESNFFQHLINSIFTIAYDAYFLK
jgi:hypothetical protein